jgi:hypothetical protein
MYQTAALPKTRVLLRARTGWSDVFMLGAKNAIHLCAIYIQNNHFTTTGSGPT